ncbi:MAG: hypothetical protein QOJ65_1326 [Fimbriimonadaceae bacterium]|nr:hypothetical protein [Fimbriimonadaceae bacterium]
MGAPIPTEELNKVDFLLGDWTGEESMMGQKSTSKTHSEWALGGRYVRTNVTYQMGPAAPPVEGMHMLTYDPDKKVYTAWWYDSAAPNVMSMKGNFEGDKLVLISDPTPMPNMPDAIFRSTWWKKGDKGLGFTLDIKEGDKWITMVDGDYKKN